MHRKIEYAVSFLQNNNVKFPVKSMKEVFLLSVANAKYICPFFLSFVHCFRFQLPKNYIRQPFDIVV